MKPLKLTINWNNPITKGLVWNSVPSANNFIDLVMNRQGSLLTSGSWNGVSPFGTSLSSSSTSNGGAYWPYTTQIDRINREFTIIVIARIDGIATFSHFMTIPYSATWSSPYYSIQFVRDNNTANAAIAWTISGANTTALGVSNGFFTVGPLAMYAVSCNPSNSLFYKNGILKETVATGISGAIDFGGKREITLLNHNSADPGEGITGIMPFAAIWKRRLTAYEHLSLYTNIWQIYTMQTGISGAVGSTAVAALTRYYRQLMGIGQ